MHCLTMPKYKYQCVLDNWRKDKRLTISSLLIKSYNRDLVKESFENMVLKNVIRSTGNYYEYITNFFRENQIDHDEGYLLLSYYIRNLLRREAINNNIVRVSEEDYNQICNKINTYERDHPKKFPNNKHWTEEKRAEQATRMKARWKDDSNYRKIMMTKRKEQ